MKISLRSIPNLTDTFSERKLEISERFNSENVEITVVGPKEKVRESFLINLNELKRGLEALK